MYLLDIQRHQKTFITSPFDYLTQPGKRACMRKDVCAFNIGKCVPVGNSMLRQIFQTDEL